MRFSLQVVVFCGFRRHGLQEGSILSKYNLGLDCALMFSVHGLLRYMLGLFLTKLPAYIFGGGDAEIASERDPDNSFLWSSVSRPYT